jgi:hypothetical protein
LGKQLVRRHNGRVRLLAYKKMRRMSESAAPPPIQSTLLAYRPRQGQKAAKINIFSAERPNGRPASDESLQQCAFGSPGKHNAAAQERKQAAFSGLVMDRQFERAARWLRDPRGSPSVHPPGKASCVCKMMDWFSSIVDLIGAALRARLMHYLQFCYAFIQTETRSERSSQKSESLFCTSLT